MQHQQQQHVVEEENVTMNDASEVDFPPLNNSQPSASTASGSEASKWADIASQNTDVTRKVATLVAPSRYSQSKKTKKTKNTTSATKPSSQQVDATKKKVERALRAFTAPTTTTQTGFSNVYYPAQARISRKLQRKNLKELGVVNSRLLDIHYPSRNVVALLVHNDYREELIGTLKSQKLQHLADYSPTHHTSLTDPQFSDLSDTEKSRIASEKHTQRIVRALPFIRDHISKAVARYFEHEGLITPQQLEEFLVQYAQKLKKNHVVNSSSTEPTIASQPVSPPSGTTDTESQQTNMDRTL